MTPTHIYIYILLCHCFPIAFLIAYRQYMYMCSISPPLLCTLANAKHAWVSVAIAPKLNYALCIGAQSNNVGAISLKMLAITNIYIYISPYHNRMCAIISNICMRIVAPYLYSFAYAQLLKYYFANINICSPSLSLRRNKPCLPILKKVCMGVCRM